MSDHVAGGKAMVRIHRDNETYCCHFKDGVKFGKAIVQVQVAGEASPTSRHGLGAQHVQVEGFSGG